MVRSRGAEKDGLLSYAAYMRYPNVRYTVVCLSLQVPHCCVEGFDVYAHN